MRLGGIGAYFFKAFGAVERLAVGFAIGLSIFGVAFGPRVIFPGTALELYLSETKILILAAILVLLGMRAVLRHQVDWTAALSFGACGMTALYCASELTSRTHGFAQSNTPIILLIVLTAICTALISRRGSLQYLWLVLLSTMISGGVGLLRASEGGLLFIDDHSSFLYRLIQLKQNFPAIPFYNPLWNGGVEAREFFASGILNVFFLFAPFIYLFDVAATYTALVAVLLFIVTPILAGFAARISGFGWGIVGLQALLTLSSSLFWYRWALSYGTLGFILSSALVPLNLALIARQLRKGEDLGFTWAILCAVALTLMFLWSPAILLFAPLALIVSLRLRSVLLKRSTWVMLFLLIALNLPWVVVFSHVSSVGQFLQGPDVASHSGSVELQNQATTSHDISKYKIEDASVSELPISVRILDNLRDKALALNPLLLFFGLGGLFILGGVDLGAVWLVAAGTAAALGLIGPIIKPQLELERMLIVLGLILALPAAVIIERWLVKFAELAWSSRIATGFILGCLGLTPFWLWQVSSNSTNQRFTFAPPLVYKLSDALRENIGEGRALFAGFTLHELSSGHVAPLAEWVGKPLIASSYQHDRWRYTDVIPLEFRNRKEAGVLEYLDLMNVSVIVTHDQFWRNWYTSRPELFERIVKLDRFVLFRPKQFSSQYFIEGAGRIMLQSGSQVDLELATQDAVIKFTYLPFLKVEGCQGVAPYPISESMRFIRLSGCEIGRVLTIRAQPIWDRIF